jgi:succinoglycan biosynthesis protein ExoL
MKLAFFGHDSTDKAIKRRIESMTVDGIDVIGFMMHRRKSDLPFRNIELGQTFDGRFAQRLKQVWVGARIAAQNRAELESADIIYARNLDMLICAYLAKARIGSKTPVIYESLDIHRLLSRNDMIGSLMRQIERFFLKRSKGVVVSSPAFLEQHFEKYYSGDYKSALIENRWLEGSFSEPRPSQRDVWNVDQAKTRKLVLGWVGMLRCQRSLDLMCALADRFRDQLVIKLHGIPALVEVPNFEAQVAAHENLEYAGPYSSPEDLFEIYSKIDIVWAGDFMEAGSNSEWLLPNRIYEGGYYAAPSIAPIGTQTEKWLRDRACGIGVEDPVETSVPELIEKILSGEIDIEQINRNLLELNDCHFVQPRGFMKQTMDQLLA